MPALLLHALCGFALSHLMLETVLDRPDCSRQFAAPRRLLAEALGMLIAQESKH